MRASLLHVGGQKQVPGVVKHLSDGPSSDAGATIVVRADTSMAQPALTPPWLSLTTWPWRHMVSCACAWPLLPARFLRLLVGNLGLSNALIISSTQSSH